MEIADEGGASHKCANGNTKFNHAHASSDSVFSLDQLQLSLTARSGFVMRPYTYCPLDTKNEEIRVVDILPSADFNAPMLLSISHTPFIPPPDDVLKDRREPLSAIKTTLPPGWGVDETMEGRFIYTDPYGLTSWQHPRGLDFGD